MAGLWARRGERGKRSRVLTSCVARQLNVMTARSSALDHGDRECQTSRRMTAMSHQFSRMRREPGEHVAYIAHATEGVMDIGHSSPTT
jgi:hypothetical protein